MTPFAAALESLRRSRGLTQTALAELIGVESSYVSALERGRRGPPQSDFVQRLIGALQLTAHEISELKRAVALSPRHFLMPNDMCIAEYELVAELRQTLGSLSSPQISAIRSILEMSRQTRGEALNEAGDQSMRE